MGSSCIFIRVEVEVRLQAGEGYVYAPGAEPLLDLGPVALQQLHRDAGVALLKGLEYAGYPAQRDARVGADAHRAALHAAGEGHLLLQAVGVLQQLAHQRRQALALRRQAHAPVPAQQQRKTRLLLQRVHDVRHARLRVAQAVRRLRDAPQLRRGQRALFLPCPWDDPLDIIKSNIDIIMSLFTNINMYVTF